MNKELFVSSTPHETKVGLVEDDLLAEVYLERENEYTLAGSIYKGRVTRVLPGMQSAFVDIGLERDAFLYVSDFMELEEHDDDLTDVVPANRSVQDMRQQARAKAEPAGASEDRMRARSRACCPQPTREPSKPKTLSEGQPSSRRRIRRSIEPLAAIPRIVSAEAIADAAAAVAAVAMAGAMAVTEDRDRGSGPICRTDPDRVSRAWPRTALRRPAEPAPSAPWTSGRTQPSVRRPDTSRCCCRESRFPSTSASRSSQPRPRIGTRQRSARIELRSPRPSCAPLPRHSPKTNHLCRERVGRRASARGARRHPVA